MAKMSFTLDHQFGSEEYKAMSEMFADRVLINLKANDILIGKITVVQIENFLTEGYGRFYFEQVY